jgi:hypothetical protein
MAVDDASRRCCDGCAERVASRIARMLASWRFVLGLLALVVSWCLLSNSFDPYPWVLLNLTLSFIAAYTAPFIMMRFVERVAHASDPAYHALIMYCRVYHIARRPSQNLEAAADCARVTALHDKIDALRLARLPALAAHAERHETALRHSLRVARVLYELDRRRGAAATATATATTDLSFALSHRAPSMTDDRACTESDAVLLAPNAMLPLFPLSPNLSSTIASLDDVAMPFSSLAPSALQSAPLPTSSATASELARPLPSFGDGQREFAALQYRMQYGRRRSSAVMHRAIVAGGNSSGHSNSSTQLHALGPAVPILLPSAVNAAPMVAPQIDESLPSTSFEPSAMVEPVVRMHVSPRSSNAAPRPAGRAGIVPPLATDAWASSDEDDEEDDEDDEEFEIDSGNSDEDDDDPDSSHAYSDRDSDDDDDDDREAEDSDDESQRDRSRDRPVPVSASATTATTAARRTRRGTSAARRDRPRADDDLLGVAAIARALLRHRDEARAERGEYGRLDAAAVELSAVSSSRAGRGGDGGGGDCGSVDVEAAAVSSSSSQSPAADASSMTGSSNARAARGASSSSLASPESPSSCCGQCLSSPLGCVLTYCAIVLNAIAWAQRACCLTVRVRRRVQVPCPPACVRLSSMVSACSSHAHSLRNLFVWSDSCVRIAF